MELETLAVWVAPVEYVILRKLQYFRDSGSDRHLRDAAMMLRVSGDQMDPAVFEPWVEDLGLHDALANARSSSVGL